MEAGRAAALSVHANAMLACELLMTLVYWVLLAGASPVVYIFTVCIAMLFVKRAACIRRAPAPALVPAVQQHVAVVW